MGEYDRAKSVLEMTNDEARDFFLRDSTYMPIQLPKYFNFSKNLKIAVEKLKNSNLSDFCETKCTPKKFNEVNYTLLLNKNGLYDWRPIQIVHPLLYVDLVKLITEESSWEYIKSRFELFRSDERISCISIPIESESNESDKAETIHNWWENLEQASIKYALDYKYCTKVDVTNCYGSLYTHTIAWAVCGKEQAKKNRKSGLGNKIDGKIMEMQNGQTNGIPQGGPLFDFIAEMVLGYSDSLLSKQLTKEEFKVIRYRDDYRVFTHDKETSGKVIKQLSEILADLNMHFNNSKTEVTEDIIGSAIKKDKLFWTKMRQLIQQKSGKKVNYFLGIQKHLLLIYELAKKFPNTGSVAVALTEFYSRIKKEKIGKDYVQLVSIVVNIMVLSPKSIVQEVAVLSEIFNKLPKEEISKVPSIVNKTLKKFDNIPNTGYVEIWLQRLSIAVGKENTFSERICNKILNPEINIWNSEWLKSGWSENNIIDKKELNNITLSVPREEVELFVRDY